MDVDNHGGGIGDNYGQHGGDSEDSDGDQATRDQATHAQLLLEYGPSRDDLKTAIYQKADTLVHVIDTRGGEGVAVSKEAILKFGRDINELVSTLVSGRE